MTESDFHLFERAFKRVGGAFRLRVKGTELEELIRTYFRVLEEFPLDDVLAAAKNCLAAYKTFPKPAEWLAAIPNKPPVVLAAQAIRTMTTDETAEYRRAERLHYEDAPCDCSTCIFANVAEKPLRFVPMFGEDGRADRAQECNSKRIVTPGYWAHGEELYRWYEARARFYAMMNRMPRLRRLLGPALVAVGDREPGIEG